MTLAGRVAVVTGGGRGIGEAIAVALVADGAAVAVWDLDDADVGGSALAVRVDVADRASVDRAASQTERHLGPVDVVVNNAGIDVVGPFLAGDPAAWDRIIGVNLYGPLNVCHRLVSGMVERGWGRVVSIASDAGKVGSSGEAVYSAAKGGVIAFTKTLAREVARHGVTVNAVCPGPTDTALLGQVAAANERLVESLRRAIPMRRIAQPGDIAPVVAFLASDAAGYITGQALSVSGGLTMS